MNMACCTHEAKPVGCRPKKLLHAAGILKLWAFQVTGS